MKTCKYELLKEMPDFIKAAEELEVFFMVASAQLNEEFGSELKEGSAEQRRLQFKYVNLMIQLAQLRKS